MFSGAESGGGVPGRAGSTTEDNFDSAIASFDVKETTAANRVCGKCILVQRSC